MSAFFKRNLNVVEIDGEYIYTQAMFGDNIVVGSIMTNAGNIKIKGNVTKPGLTAGNTYRFTGRWHDHPKYGRQFLFESYTMATPNTKRGVIAYLTQHVPHIGEITASKLWDAYGADTVEVISSNPARVAKDKIMPTESAFEASESIKSMSTLRETTIAIYDLLSGRGFPKKLPSQLIDKYGAKAPELISENPYRLILDKFHGCGFKRVDAMYLDIGKDPNAIEPPGICAWHSLENDMTGNTWTEAKEAIMKIRSMIGGTSPKPYTAILEAIKMGLITAYPIEEPKTKSEILASLLADKKKSDQEISICESVKRLLGHTNSLWPKGEISDLTEHQNVGAANAMMLPVGLLIGNPGTGKTFTMSRLLKLISETIPDSTIAVCAPTGKAAVRCTNAMLENGIQKKATTIHSLLGIGMDDAFAYNKANCLPFKVIIIDEMSMVGTPLLSSLLAACADGTHVLMIGDKYQLPPVEHGAPLRDMMKILPSYGELTEIHRNSGTIVKACATIKSGIVPEFDEKIDLESVPNKNLKLVRFSDPEAAVNKVVKAIERAKKLGFNPIDDVQVCVPLNAKSLLSRANLNPILQNNLNPNGFAVSKCNFRVGDKIICLKNGNYASAGKPDGRKNLSESYPFEKSINDETGESEIAQHRLANGEIGIVLAVGERHLVAKFPFPERTVKVFNNKQRTEDEEDGNDSSASETFAMAYAVTVHKMQGSEVKCAIMVLDPCRGAAFVQSRESLYTGISRGRNLTIVIGSEKTAGEMIRNVSINKRKTLMPERFAAITEPKKKDGKKCRKPKTIR